MKKIATLTLLFLSLFFFPNCHETCIEIPPLGQGIASDRKVLIEEFTGVSCPNCPQGAAEIENLLAIHGENLVAVSIHAGEFTDLLPENKFDFRTDAGNSLLGYLGAPLGYPSAVVDRRQFSGANSLQSFKSKWAGNIVAELQRAPSMALILDRTFDDASRQLVVNVTILPVKNLPGEHRLSLMLTETGIKDAQDVLGTIVVDYSHKHVLRDMLTPFDGLVLTENLSAGSPVERSFSFTLPANWVAGNCKIVAFVHHGGNPDKEVLQVAEKGISD